MLYRRTGLLALQAAVLLALEPDGTLRPIRELAEELGVGPTYLTKIIQSLTRVGLLRAARGPGGGVQLARPPEQITPWDVMTAMEPVDGFTQCLLATRQCNEAAPCSLHDCWAPTRNLIRERLETSNLREFAVEALRWGKPFWKLEGGGAKPLPACRPSSKGPMLAEES